MNRPRKRKEQITCIVEGCDQPRHILGVKGKQRSRFCDLHYREDLNHRTARRKAGTYDALPMEDALKAAQKAAAANGHAPKGDDLPVVTKQSYWEVLGIPLSTYRKQLDQKLFGRVLDGFVTEAYRSAL